MSLFSAYEPGGPRGAPLEVELRAARAADAEALTALVVEREGRAPAEVRRGFERETGEAFAHERHRLFVAEHAGRAVAFARSRRWEADELGLPGPRRPPAGWYLSGVVVRPDLRRRGIARALTALRIEDLRGEAAGLLYFVNARNRASIDLHAAFGFEELTRDFEIPGISFEGGEGILFRLRLGGAG